MTRIESEHVEVNCSAKETYEYLTNLKNIKELLPQDKISDWQANENSCSFKIQGAATIPIVFTNGIEYSEINYHSGEKAPFKFTLSAHLIEKNEQLTEGYLLFEGDINPFLKMMVQKPLGNLFNYMAKRLAEVKA